MSVMEIDAAQAKPATQEQIQVLEARLLDLPQAGVVSLPADRLAEVAPLGRAFYAEGGLPGSFRLEVFEQTWRGLLAMDSGRLFAIESDGRLVGVLGAIIYPDPNDGALVATEMFWFVSEEARGRGLRLLQAFERWAHERGAARLLMVHLCALKSEQLERLYHKRGYRPVEIHYIKELT